MSINLHAKGCDDLLQTPTWITYLAMYDSSGHQRDWRETRHIYVGWLKSRTNGTYSSTKEADDYRDFINMKVEEIMSCNDIEFFAG